MRSKRFRRRSRAPLVAIIAVMCAAVWFLPFRGSRSARNSAPTESSRPILAENPDDVTVRKPAESPDEVTLAEYAGLCKADDVTGCERACDRGDAASCRSLG